VCFVPPFSRPGRAALSGGDLVVADCLLARNRGEKGTLLLLDADLLWSSLSRQDYARCERFASTRTALSLRGHQLLRPPAAALAARMPLLHCIEPCSRCRAQFPCSVRWLIPDLDNAIYRIVATFRQHLETFSFPQRVSPALYRLVVAWRRLGLLAG
jgi:hypothetical protein